jgi:DNA-binding transcriptional ArsR family regulator
MSPWALRLFGGMVASPLSTRKRNVLLPPKSGDSTDELKTVKHPQRSAGAAGQEATSLDELIHHRIRLGILSALAATDSLSFGELKALLKTTDGNLSVHARKLEDANYVVCSKTFEERRPRTDYRLASQGRHALNRYLKHMEALIQAARQHMDR